MGRWILVGWLALCTVPARAGTFWVCTDPNWVPVLQDTACAAPQHTLLGDLGPVPAQSTATMLASSARAGRGVSPLGFAAPAAGEGFDPLDEPVYKALWLVAAGALLLSFGRVVLLRDWRLRAVGRGRMPQRRHPVPQWPPVGTAAVPPAPGPVAQVRPRVRPTRWSAELIRDLEWDRFGTLCAGVWHAKGYRVELSPPSAEHSVDMFLYDRQQPDKVYAAVQFKAWRAGAVGEEVVRDVWNAASQLKASMALVYATCEFTEEAIQFAMGKQLLLLRPGQLLEQVLTLEPVDRDQLLRAVTRDDGEAPACPQCGARATLRVGAPGEAYRWVCRSGAGCTWPGAKVA